MPSATRPPYPDNWNNIARAAKRRAGWCCELCAHPHDPQAGYTLTVHHRDGNPQNNRHDNLVALCQRCHMPASAREARYGRAHRQQPRLPHTQMMSDLTTEGDDT